MSKQLEHYGYKYTPKVDCKFHWAGDCTPDQCNFVYCEHNTNRVFAAKNEFTNTSEKEKETK